MSDAPHRYPEGTAATLKDFERSGWKDIAEAHPGRVGSRWNSCSEAAATAMTEGDAPKARVLWLLADVCSPMLRPNSANEPFAPLMVIEGRRSVVPGDLTESDLSLLQELLPAIDDPELAARIADILWLRLVPRRPDYARAAITSYTAGGLDEGIWNRERSDGWNRALTLAQQLRANELTETLTSNIEQAVLLASPSEGTFARSLAKLLETKQLWSEAPKAIADKLAAFGEAHKSRDEPTTARMYFDSAATWYARARDIERQADMTCASAEAWADEAKQRTSGTHASNFVASSFYENAIQVYRGVARKQREARGVDKRITELRQLLTSTGQASLEEMGRVQTGRTDVTDLVNASVAAVQGKSKLDALFELATLSSGPNLAKIVALAEEQMRQTPLQSLFASSHLSRDGRVIAKRPAGDFGAAATGADNPAVWCNVMQHFGIHVSLVVQGQIIHALGALLLEHVVAEAECCDLVAASGIVAPDRVLAVGKALFAGFDRDFLTALHLLIPQVEAMVRLHLKRFGAKTATLDSVGIETENGMGTLVELPEMQAAFGENLTFELKALFCDALGPNLRNELAHGLLDSSVGNTAPAVYAWWFLFRLAFLSFWNRRVPASEAAAAEAAEPATEAPLQP